MIKNYIEARGYKIIVNDNSLRYYLEDELVAETWGFINEDHTKEHEGRIALKLHNQGGSLKDYGWLLIEVEEFEELLNIRKSIIEAIENYFNNLDNIKLHELSNGSIVFAEETEEYKKLEELNKGYFYEQKENWIMENRKYFAKDTTWDQNGMGMMESETTYLFSKEKIEEVEEEISEYKQSDEYKTKLETEKKYEELQELADKMGDEEFEDITGMKKEFLIRRRC